MGDRLFRMSWLATSVDLGLRAVARRWYPIWLFGLGTFVALPWLAPVLAANGFDTAASIIYFVYRPTCHQLPHHSWFLFGPELTPAWPSVQPFSGLPLDDPLGAFHSPIGHPRLGYQTAICQRDSAIFGSLLAGSVAFGAVRALGWRPRSLPFAWYGLAVLPTVIDGLTQLFGWRESTPAIRTVTGAVLGLASAALVLPMLETGFEELAASDPPGGRQTPERGRYRPGERAETVSAGESQRE